MLELLSPAGSYEGFVAAMKAGADAVYAGGSAFGARAYAANFSDEEMLKAIDEAHLINRKLYMTVNTLCKEREFDALRQFLTPFYEQGLDGVIVQDLGVISFLNEEFPDMEIHASTQMTLTNVQGAEYLKELGATRIVPAREISLKEIKEIHDKTGLEIEAFIHGAMCYSYSGQCLFSSFLGGRSGNRGRCAQPCRQPYTVIDDNETISTQNEEYVLSMKDLCTLKLLPELIESGITSFKIEGRMKKSEYTGFVTSVYRKYIDMYLENGSEGYNVSDEDFYALINAYKRTDPEDGYYKKYNSRSLITLKKPSYETSFAESPAADNESSSLVNLGIYGYAYFHKNEQCFISVSYKDINITEYGAVCDEAQKRAVSESDIEKQLSKTGDTGFYFEQLDIDAGEDVFIAVKLINELRRKAIDKLKAELLKNFRRTKTVPSRDINNRGMASLAEYTILCEEKEHLKAVMESQICSAVNRIYIECSLLIKDQSVWELLKDFKGTAVYIAMPYIFRIKDIHIFDTFWREFHCYITEHKYKIDGFLIRNYEELFYIKESLGSDYNIISDFNVYTFNQHACEQLLADNVKVMTIPLELNCHEIKERGYLNISELLYYGYIPMIISAGCISKTLNRCSKNHQGSKMYLRDRYNKDFPVIRECIFDTNRILNSLPLYLGSEKDFIDRSGIAFKRIQFSVESKAEALSILDSIFKDKKAAIEYTKGHFRKSVE